MALRTVHLRIEGLVQGVSYRGWVRNLPNGDVEALAAGPTNAVVQFVTWCKRGPEEARVSNVTMTETALEPGLSGFEVRR